MVFDAFIQALGYFGNSGFLLFLGIGVIVGIIGGIIPGISSLLTMALILPFIFTMLPEHALPLMVAISAVGYTGGSITAILLNIPGTAPSAATLIDGYPMTLKGEGGRALGAALMSSGIGGIATVFLALAMVPLLLPMVMAIVSADMVFIILLGLSFISVLSAGSMLKGLVSGGLGLMIAFIGFQAVTGVPRFTFGSLYLYDGIGLIPLALGLFAIPEAINLAARGGTIAKTETVIKGMHDIWEGAKDVFRHWGLWLRSTIIGYIIGIIPGIGAMAATFIAYGQAKQTSKHPERFGTGIVEGVIAPESANNAKEAGSLLTTLALGIPGSAAMAMLLGAFLMLGIIPGPDMLTIHLPLSLSLLLVIIVANVLAVIICFPAAPHLAKIAYIPSRILAPLILVISLIGAFTFQESFNDVIVALIFSVLGLTMRRFGFNRPSLFLGYILGGLFERYLFLALRTAGPLFFLRPISMGLIIIIIALFTFEPAKRAFQRRKGLKKA